MGEWVTLDTHHGPVRAWQAEPDGKPRGGLVVIQEIFGANAHIREVAEGFAAKGYAVLAPSFFDLVDGPAADPDTLPYDPDGVKRGLERVTALGVEKALEVVRAAASRLAPAGRVGTVGYCWGGSIALLAALRLGLPSVSYYGARNVQFLDETAKAPVMFHFGAQDRSIPPEAIKAHREKLPQMATFVYPADHAFNRNVGHAYDPDSAALALERTLDFFAEHLG
ncbi:MULTISPECIES: dienelactone hydrolase family protein [Stenotrophomonas]|jgi:carboxymethylenebutenolidase|uniref:dienelactone hydrolase family protein n=2 Tax=Lysobacteraceae TaxID=32033 RepID=UPI0002E0359C|nr:MULTISPECIES: dienelactone hydrolase family protein [Stenotrophomonas]MBD3825742.1 dienelactone hydrolase family protein [Stenotrophomonas sp.]QIO88962.1 carboxymethylenebutenolidase [Stenotrophomonas rhizophila]HBS63125.1 dienelactone hydrolase family protein [Stenotrophomonas sp.]